ncbi:DUF6247 family protein [Pseudonocardia hydrocarbonoxydans]|uniref:Uncharacterized protein n=1 Tax=Pseudonocardia hydrocarbonoxydans TaxID=76726 RepID=A0A4Y3WVA5_9PSEU|nr:DUF6247 family protein [Pseudonocardia hydrocarbonoxydans]GEC22498.1 hypothetical protein PHY01_47810 [Pseudonocardia hydrocarbonoxydans]
MSATYAYDEQPAGGHPLAPGASPAAIRAALLPADQAGFDVAYGTALAASRVSLDLGELFQMLEQWRRLALLQRDPENFVWMVRRVAETLTGEPVPDGEPFELTRAKAGL